MRAGARRAQVRREGARWARVRREGDRRTWALPVAAVMAVALVGCGDGGADFLPGHSRPILEHDWPDPSELDLEPNGFTPPDPAESLFQASSGLRAYIVTEPSAPLVRLTAALPLGQLHEADGEAGGSALLTRLLTTRGAAGASRPLSLRLAELGTTLTAEETLDVTRISLNVLPEDWREGLELIVELLKDPDLNASAVRQYRAGPGYSMPVAGVGGAGFRPKVELERTLSGYPLAPPDPGSTLSLAALRGLASRALRADRVVLGIGGNVPRDAAKEAVESTTRGWGRSAEPAASPVAIQPSQPQAGFHAVDVPSLEGWVAIGTAQGAIPESDRAPLAVLAFILGERLNIAVREIRGLANRAPFHIPETASGTGLVHIRTGGRPEAVAPLIRFSLDEVQRMYDPQDPVTAGEVARAQGWLVDAVWQRSLEVATSASATFAVEQARHGNTDLLMGWPAAVRAVTASDIKTTAQQRLDPRTLVTVVVGPLARIREARHPRWPVALDELEASLSGGG